MEALSLAWTFFKVGIIAFGGGWSVVGVIKTAVVPRWMDDPGFRSLIAVAQSTPGPIALNAATMIGWYRGGLGTALLATLSVVAFPCLAIIASIALAKAIKVDRPRIEDTLKTSGLAMMLMTLWVLRPASADPLLLLLAAGAFYVGAFTKVNSLWAILGAGAINAALGPALRSLF